MDGRELRAGVRTGIRRYVLEVVTAASRRSRRCVVYTDRATGIAVDLPGVTCRVLSAAWTQWWDQVSLPRALAEDGASVFLSPYYKGPLRAPCPVVLTIHDLFFIGYPGRHRPVYDAIMTRLARLYARRAAAIIADSEDSKRMIVSRLGVASSKVIVIPVALGAEFTVTPLNDRVKGRYGIASPYILYVGNFKPHKNLPRLLRAYAMLPGPLRDTHALVLAGGDAAGRPELERLAGSLGLHGRVILPGLVADADLPALYSGATLVVLPSLVEGFGLPALEAMACGAVVVASSRGALPEVVADAGLLVDPEDEAAIAEAMTRGLSDDRLRRELRHRGLARAPRYAPAETADRVLAVLAEAGGGRR